MTQVWKTEWTKVKGHAWLKHECHDNMKICYNCIFQCFSEDGPVLSNLPWCWYSNQIFICLKEVLQALEVSWNQCKPGCEKFIDDVLDTCKHFKRSLENLKPKNQQICTDLEKQCFRLINLLVVISLTKKDVELHFSKITELVNLWSDVGHMPSVLMKILICKQQKVTDHSFLEKECVSNPVLTYVMAYTTFKEDQFQEALLLCTKFFDSNHDIPDNINIPLLYNIMACCHAVLKKPLSAIMYWRKAVLCKDGAHLLPIIFNLYQSYVQCDMKKVAIKILATLSSAAKIAMNEEASASILMITLNLTDNTKQPRLKLIHFNGCPEMIDLNRAKYLVSAGLASSEYYGNSIIQYSELIDNLKRRHNSSSTLCSSNYHLAIHIPKMVQLIAELCCLFLTKGKFENVLEVECPDLLYCTNYFKSKQANVLPSALKNGKFNSSEDDSINLYNEAAMQFYHCLSIMLCKISVHIGHDYSKAKNEIRKCLQVMDTVPPCSQCYDDQKDGFAYYALARKLSVIKARLYFNDSLVLSKLANYQENELLKSLQAALQYDSRDIDMRWNAVMLLWKIGQKQESIKTWCKTRSIDYRKPINELQCIYQEKLSILAKCTTTARKDLLQKDISILQELFSILN